MDGSTARPTAGRAFRITAAVLGVLLIGLSLPFAVVAIVSSDPSQSIHRFHLTAGAVPTLILAAALLVLWLHPGAIAALQLFVVGAIVSLLVGLASGDLFSGFYFLGVVIAAILLALYPGRAGLWRAAGPRLRLLGAAIVAAVPSIAYTLAQASLQRHGSPLDPHAEMHHYSGVAVSAVALPAAVLVAAIGGAGWRIVGWIAATAFVLFGVFGLAFSTYASAPAVGWSWASVAAGLAVFALTELEADRPTGPHGEGVT
jgi:hypothetical protein